MYLDTDSAWIQPRNLSLRTIYHSLSEGVTFFAAREPDKSFLANGVFGSTVQNDPSLKWLIRRCGHLVNRSLQVSGAPPYMVSGPFLFDDLEYMIHDTARDSVSTCHTPETLGLIATTVFYPFNWKKLEGVELQSANQPDSFHRPELFPPESIMMQYGYSTNLEKQPRSRSFCSHDKCWIAASAFVALLWLHRTRRLRFLRCRRKPIRFVAPVLLASLAGLLAAAITLKLKASPDAHLIESPSDASDMRGGLKRSEPDVFQVGVHSNSSGTVELSAHTCIGGSFLPDAWLHRTCHFRNLYTDQSTWYYVVPDESARAFMAQHSNLSVAMAPNSADPAYRNVVFNPIIITVAELSQVKTVVQTDTRPTFFFAEYNGENFGHVLTDSLFPAYSALATFGLLPSVVQNRGIEDPVLLLSDEVLPWNCFWQRANLGEAGERAWSRCTRFHNELYPLVTSNPLQFFNSKRHAVAGPRALRRFKDLVAGSGDLTDHCDDPTIHGARIDTDTRHCNAGKSSLLHQFVEFSMANIGLNPNTNAHRRAWIIIWQREATDGLHTRTIGDTDELLKHLRSEVQRSNASWLAGIKVMDASFVRMPIKRQIEWFRDCAVFIGPSGGGSYIAMFMPMHASYIQLSENERDYGMDWQLFNSLVNLEVTYIRSDHDPNWAYTLQAVDRALDRWSIFTTDT